MDPFVNIQNQQFDPQLYESSNVPPSTDKLYSFSGHQAGLITNSNIAYAPDVSNTNNQSQQQHQGPEVLHQVKNQPHYRQQQVQPPSILQFDCSNTSLQQQAQQVSAFIPSLSVIRNSNSAPPPTNITTVGESKRYSGMYASTGFDMISVLSRLVNRPNPQIDLGPVDLSCSFVVVDAKQYDLPVVYCSPMFERLTGYHPVDVIGRNCRFLQAPDGRVANGSRRKYTDNSTVYHIKTHIVQGKESQSSLINYRKTGQPFVNLLTVIPIAWDVGTSSTADEIDYFVGLQVDLVDQPNCIFQNMKDGTYTVNYRHSMVPPTMPGSVSGSFNTEAPSGELTAVEEWRRPVSPQQQHDVRASNSNNLSNQQYYPASISEPHFRYNNGGSSGSSNAMNAAQQQSEMPSITWMSSSSSIQQQQPTNQLINVETLIREASTDEGRLKRCWHELLLDESPDFIHVLTIKGMFLYCSDSIKDILEYDPTELVGQSVRTICHPSDITTVMRELKQSSHHPTEPVNLIYRVRRKNAGYKWIECCGKLRHEDGRGRKYVVLSGRERPVYQLPKNLLSTADHKIQEQHEQGVTKIQGAKDHGFWGKLSLDGLLLYVSWTCANILGTSPSEIIGTSLYQLMRSNRTTDLTRALAEVKEGKIVYLKHALLNGVGMEVMVATTFYPDGGSCCSVSAGTAFSQSNSQNNNEEGHHSSMQQPSFVLMHTTIDMDEEYPEDANGNGTKEESVFLSIDPDLKKKGKMDQQYGSSPSTVDRMINEVSIANDANWQYELHQLRITNKKLRGELGELIEAAKQNGLDDTATCSHCFRRLPGTNDIQQEDNADLNASSSSASNCNQENILCNMCSIQLHLSATGS